MVNLYRINVEESSPKLNHSSSVMMDICSGGDSYSVFILVVLCVSFYLLFCTHSTTSSFSFAFPLTFSWFFFSLFSIPSVYTHTHTHTLIQNAHTHRMTSRCGQSFFLHLKLAAIEEWQESAHGWIAKREGFGGCGW